MSVCVLDYVDLCTLEISRERPGIYWEHLVIIKSQSQAPTKKKMSINSCKVTAVNMENEYLKLVDASLTHVQYICK